MSRSQICHTNKRSALHDHWLPIVANYDRPCTDGRAVLLDSFFVRTSPPRTPSSTQPNFAHVRTWARYKNGGPKETKETNDRSSIFP